MSPKTRPAQRKAAKKAEEALDEARAERRAQDELIDEDRPRRDVVLSDFPADYCAQLVAARVLIRRCLRCCDVGVRAGDP